MNSFSTAKARAAHLLPDLCGGSAGTEALFRESRYCERGAVLYRSGDIPAGIYHIRSGVVKIYRPGPRGEECVLALASGGAYLGLAALMQNARHAGSAAAVQQVEARFCERAAFLQYLEANPAHKLQLMQLMCRELEARENQLLCLEHKSARQRAAAMLLMLADTFGLDSNGNILLALQDGDLANLAHIARGTLHKVLREMQSDGYICIHGSGICLLDRKGLQAMAGN